jgi:hypothetical protein
VQISKEVVVGAKATIMIAAAVGLNLKMMCCPHYPDNTFNWF